MLTKKLGEKMDDLKKQTIFHFKMIDLYRKYLFRQASKKTGVFRGQFPLLEYISHHDGCSQIAMSKEYNISAAAIAKSINRLENANLIRKVADDSNKRANLIYITDLGKKTLENSKAQFEEIDELGFKDFSDEEILTFKNLVDRMLMNLLGSNEIDDNNLCQVINNLLREDGCNDKKDKTNIKKRKRI